MLQKFLQGILCNTSKESAYYDRQNIFSFLNLNTFFSQYKKQNLYDFFKFHILMITFLF